MKQEAEQEQEISKKEQEEGEGEKKKAATCLSEINEKTPPVFVPLKLLPEMIKELTNGNDQEQYHATMCIRKLLSVKDNPPTTQVVQAGAVPLLVKQLNKMEDEKVIFEATWAISNIASASASDVQAILEEEGALDLIISQLTHPSDQVREQAAWCVGNLAGDSVKVRDTLIMLDVPLILSHALKIPTEKIAVTRNMVWAMSNLVRGKPKADAVRTKPIVGAVTGLVASSTCTDEDVLIDALWTISYYSENSPECAQTVIESGIIPLIIQKHLTAPNWLFQLPAVRIIGNLATGTEAQSRLVVESGALATFGLLMQHPRRTVVKETTWTVGNLIAGESSSFPICQLVAQAGLLPLLCKNLNAQDVSARTEATYALYNFASKGSKELVKQAVESCGMLEQAVKNLGDTNVKVIEAKLDLINVILLSGDEIAAEMQGGEGEETEKKKEEAQQKEGEEKGEGEEKSKKNKQSYFLAANPEVAQALIHRLEDLLEHPSQSVYETAFEMAQTYFPGVLG